MVGVSVERLLEQMQEAGISGKNETAEVSESERQELLNHLKRSHGEDAADGEPRKITLKRKTTSTLKVAGASGKKKTVNVEVRKKRTYVKRSEMDPAEQAEAVSREDVAKVEADAARQEEERLKQEAEAAEAKAAREAEEKAAREAEEAAKQAETEAQKQKDAEEAARLKREEEEEKRRKKEEAQAEARFEAQKQAKQREGGRDDRRSPKGKKKGGDDNRRGGKLSRNRGKNGKPLSNKPNEHGFKEPTKQQVLEVTIPESITVADLAKKMNVKAAEVIKVMFGMGAMATINQVIDQDTATLLVEEMGHTPKPMQENAVEEKMTKK
jgi:translation initiation factor IF-2